MSHRQEDIVPMQSKAIHERRVIFRPYSQNGSDSDIYVCTGCGMQFTRSGDMGAMTIRFAEHLCEPIITSSSEGSVGLQAN